LLSHDSLLLQSPSLVHCTQTLGPVSQTGVDPLQSPSLWHPELPPVQTLLLHDALPLQSPSLAHSTHVLLSQMGVEPPQSLSLLHEPPPVLPEQVFVTKSQVPLPQSRLLKHWTHLPSPEQSGAFEFVQSPARAHSTHCPAALQIGLPEPVQSEAPAHCTHSPWAVSQTGVAPLHPELAVQPLVH
jgi:hypothetical protein